jgi:hypothetical protein
MPVSNRYSSYLFEKCPPDAKHCAVPVQKFFKDSPASKTAKLGVPANNLFYITYEVYGAASKQACRHIGKALAQS